MITFLNLKNSLKQTQFPALCLCGNDRWIVRKSLNTICEVYGIVDDGFGVDNLEAPSFKDVEMSCYTPSMFCPLKLVVVENFEFPKGRQQQEAIDAFSRLIQNCDGSYCVAFVASEPSPYDKIQGITLVNCDKLDSENIVRWIIAYGKRQGVEIGAACARKISDYCLQDMSRVSSETQKLIDYGEVSVSSVEMLVHKDTEYIVYNLSKKIADKDAQGAIELYKGLIASGEEARGLFGLLYNTYRRAYYAKTSDMSVEQMATALGVKSFAVEKAKEIANKYKPMQLKRVLNFFEDADIKLKAFIDETEVMVTLIMQIVSL